MNFWDEGGLHLGLPAHFLFTISANSISKAKMYSRDDIRHWSDGLDQVNFVRKFFSHSILIADLNLLIMKKLLIPMLLLMTSVISAQELRKDEFAISVGYLFAGELYVYAPVNRYFSFGESYIVKLEYAHYFEAMSKRFGAGLYVSTANPYYGAFENVSMAELGILLKGRFNVSEKVQIKPWAYVGYRSYGSKAGQGLGVNANVAFQYQMQKIKPFVEIGFLTQPDGGTDAATATFGPTFQTSIGLAFWVLEL
jgi:hypothetical protein